MYGFNIILAIHIFKTKQMIHEDDHKLSIIGIYMTYNKYLTSDIVK